MHTLLDPEYVSRLIRSPMGNVDRFYGFSRNLADSCVAYNRPWAENDNQISVRHSDEELVDMGSVQVIMSMRIEFIRSSVMILLNRRLKRIISSLGRFETIRDLEFSEYSNLNCCKKIISEEVGATAGWE